MPQWIYQKGEEYTIGSALQKLRHKNHLTQEAVAAQLQVRGLDITREMYAQMETGTYGIRISVLIGLKKIFDAEYCDFFIDLP